MFFPSLPEAEKHSNSQTVFNVFLVCLLYVGLQIFSSILKKVV
jgi:hypothetical protein